MIFLLYLILNSFTSTGSELIPDHHFVVKRPFGSINGPTGQSFRELLQGDFYMDKTYILKEVLKSHRFKTLVITLPSKWGKSLNLDMIKSFLEIEVNSRGDPITPIYKATNYRLFRQNELMENGSYRLLYQPLYISFCHSVLKHYQGQRPVIFLDFGNMNESSYKGVLREVGRRIKTAFDQHDYMLSVLIEHLRAPRSIREKNQTVNKINGYTKITLEKANYEDLIESLELLSKILYEHFGFKVFILVDNYEGVMLNVLTNTEIKESESPLILAFFSSLMVRSFQSNVYLERGILTGSFKMLNLIPHLINVTDYKSTQHCMMRLYSIDHEVLLSIFDRLSVPYGLRTKAISWYEGYHWGKELCYSIYGPQSVMNFISTGKIDYLKKRHEIFDPVFESVFKYRKLRTYILWFLYGKPILVSQKEIRPQQFLINFIKFKEALLKTNNPFDEQSIEPYLCSVGILAIVKLHGGFGSHVRIPNHAVRMEVAEKLMQFYAKDFNISIPAVNQAIESVAMFVSSKDTELENMTLFLQSMTRNEALMNDLMETKSKENEIFELFLCFIFNYITFQITLSYDYQIESIEKVQLNKWTLFNDQSVTFIQFRVNATSAEYVLNISKNHATTMTKFTQLKTIQFVAINFRPDVGVEVCAESQPGPFVFYSDYTMKPPPIYAI